MVALVPFLFVILIVAVLAEIHDVWANGLDTSSTAAKSAALLMTIYLTGEVLHLATIAAPIAGTLALYQRCSDIEARATDEEMAQEDDAFQRDNVTLGRCADRFQRLREPLEKLVK